jgi:hypothetical protein
MLARRQRCGVRWPGVTLCPWSCSCMRAALYIQHLPALCLQLTAWLSCTTQQQAFLSAHGLPHTTLHAPSRPITLPHLPDHCRPPRGRMRRRCCAASHVPGDLPAPCRGMHGTEACTRKGCAVETRSACRWPAYLQGRERATGADCSAVFSAYQHLLGMQAVARESLGGRASGPARQGSSPPRSRPCSAAARSARRSELCMHDRPVLRVRIGAAPRITAGPQLLARSLEHARCGCRRGVGGNGRCRYPWQSTAAACVQQGGSRAI